jgi:DNA-binding GntR family transcriptional regulator
MKKVKYAIERQKTLREQIVESIKESIATGKLKPGEKICETKLAEDLGISRTPLREAIQTLEAEGFLNVVPRKGAVVSEYSKKDIEDIYEIKATLEGLAARLATKNLSDEDIYHLGDINNQLKSMSLKNESSVSRFFRVHNQFHELFLKASNNERLYQLNCQLMEPFKRFRLSSLAIPGRFEEAIAIHDEIVEAFRSRNAQMVETLVMQNVREGGKALLRKLAIEESER